ncbi:gibberellin-regulated protein 11-like [Gastrolobium bilobum]|uniref:gibberellin-regulated protein 11-like n=1 Tax=Gastrolobium bilobum TaxID=150636 RepID=UPI002AAF13CE|nr:gibberellin-regulated protein 11-like [Gastrolobium bilobum]
MAFSKLLVVSLLLLASLLLLHFVDADQPAYAPTQGTVLPQIDCNGACAARCRLSSRPNLCQRACGSCCRRCNCVPPGTAGNEDVCPCYANLTTHGGQHKCP